MALKETHAEQHAFILIVDDVVKNLQVLGSLLSAEGYQFTPAMNGKQALKIVAQRRPDLILLDVMMPEMDGFEVCAQLKASPATREIPVIFLTAKTETDDVVEGFERGAVDYVTKPFRREELLSRVKTHLELHFTKKNLQEAKDELQELNATKDKFFSIISHDLRGPFNGFLGLTQFMMENIAGYSQDKILEMLGKQHDAAKSLYALLENLLAWSRLQRGVMEHKPEKVWFGAMVNDIMTLFQATAEQKQISLKNSVPLKLIIQADQNMLDTVVRNLVSNALKFSEAGGNVSVSLEEREDLLEVAVSDSGVGMDRDTVATLFRIDVKHSTVGTAGERGTGLGLILCKELVEHNGGEIWVESEAGKGTTFKFTLPACSSAPA